MAYRSQEFEKIADGRSVLEIALDIHMANTGAADASPESYARDRVALQEVLRNWRPSDSKDWRAFDDLVKELINVALHEKSVMKGQ